MNEIYIEKVKIEVISFKYVLASLIRAVPADLYSVGNIKVPNFGRKRL